MPGIQSLLAKEPKKKIKREKRDNSGLWLSKAIDAYQDNILSEPGKGGSFHASAVGNPCDRYLWLYYRGLLPAQEIPAKLRRIFDHGNITEYRYAGYFKNMGLLYKQQVSVRVPNPPM